MPNYQNGRWAAVSLIAHALETYAENFHFAKQFRTVIALKADWKSSLWQPYISSFLMPNPGLRKNSNESKASETRISIALTFRQLRQKIGKKPSAESFASLLRNRPPGSDCLMQMRRLAKPPHKFQSGTFLSFFLPSISCGVKGLPTNSTKAWYWSSGRRIVFFSKKFSSKTLLRADRTICVLVVPCVLPRPLSMPTHRPEFWSLTLPYCLLEELLQKEASAWN